MPDQTTTSQILDVTKNPDYLLAIGWTFLILILIYMLWLFAKSAVCRDESFDPLGNLRPLKERPFSYSRVQLFWWSLIIIFCYGFFFVQYGELLELNATTAILLGGPVSVFALGKTIDNSQIQENNSDVPTRHQDKKTEGFLQDILSDDNGISIHRLQAAIFNVIYGLGFLEYFFSHIHKNPVEYPFMDFKPWQFVLLGISAAGYVGVKATENNKATLPERKADAVETKAKIQSVK